MVTEHRKKATVTERRGLPLEGSNHGNGNAAYPDYVITRRVRIRSKCSYAHLNR